MMQTIKWGIIGCGDVTEVKSGPALQKASHSALVAVMRRNGKLAEDYAQRHHVPRWYDQVDALINDPDVNAIYVATPPSSHKALTIAALQAGKPVYVEKPMALNDAECQQMLQAAQMANMPLYVAYYRRALPRFLKVKALLDSGAIGDVRMVTIKLHRPASPADSNLATLPWRLLPEISGGGYFVDLASHMLDLLDFFFGPIAKVQAFAANQGRQYRAEDIVSGAFVFDSGVHGTGSWCFTGFESEDVTEIVGSLGKIRYATFENEPVVLTTKEGRTEFSFPDLAHIQQPLIQTVVDDLLGKGSCLSTGESAARTSWVIDQMLAGYF